MKKLPIGKQSFEAIINDNYLYVDKTKQIYDLITESEISFISRPRRFGKSLLCSTLEAIFRGKKELFKDLWIYNADYDWKKYPIIRIDMSLSDKRTPKDFEESLHIKLEEIAREYDFEFVHACKLFVKLQQLIKGLAKRHGKVVIIIDEYDKPIVDHISNPEVANHMRSILNEFYSMFKPLDEHIKFLFITGVSQFAKTSIFSGLNNLFDLTLEDQFSSLLGYSQDELEDNFSEYINHIEKKLGITHEQMMEDLKVWYNGYRFSGKGDLVYNPFSTMSFFRGKRFRNYWFSTGTPTFLYNLLQDKVIPVANKKFYIAKEIELEQLKINDVKINTLLYQTGYLTIKSYDEDRDRYHLNFPNREVEKSFIEGFLSESSSFDMSEVDDIAFDLVDALKANDLQLFFDALFQLISALHYPTHNAGNEEYYQMMVHLILKLLRIRIATEVPTNRGRIDSVVFTKTHIYIIEFKVNKSAQAAIEQTEEKKYFEQFLLDGREVVLVGINFDIEKRNLDEWISKIVK